MLGNILNTFANCFKIPELKSRILFTLIVLAIYPLAVLPMGNTGKRLRKVARRTQAELGDMTSRLTEKLSGARLIKAFRLEGYAIDRLNKSFEQVYELRMKAVRARGRMGPALEALAPAAMTLATAEGLDAHRRSVAVRLDRGGSKA